MIRHTVVFRLKHERHSDAEKDFLDAAQILATIPGVQKFEQLSQVSPKNDFAFGSSMEFHDQTACAAYENHPEHIPFVRERWLSEVEDFLEIECAASRIVGSGHNTIPNKYCDVL